MERIEGEFTQVTRLKIPGHLEIPAGWFVISYHWISEKGERRQLHGRWFRIKSPKGKIFRILRFSPHLDPKSSDALSEAKGEMIVDWPGWIELNGYEGETEKQLGLELKEAQWWNFPQIVLSHPDPVYRLSGFLGLLSVALGLLSLILTL